MKSCAVPVIVLVLAVPAIPGRAQAEPQRRDPTGAQALFYKARAQMQLGRYAEACPNLEASLRLDAGIGTQFNLADCNEHIGKMATAWAGFIDVATAAKAAHQVEREAVARKRAQALEARLPKLLIDTSSAPAGVTVTRDGVPVAPSVFGVEVPIDPGAHHVAASAPGMPSWQMTVHAVEGKTARVAVPRDLAAPVAADALPVASGATTTVTSAPAPEPDPAGFPAPVVQTSVSPQRVTGWALAGAGVIGAGLGVGFGLASIGDRNDSRAHCAGDRCDSDGVRMRDDAIRHGTVATISMVAGGAAIAGGIALALTAPRGVEHPERGRLRAVPNVASEGGGLLLQGVFQ